MSKSKSQGQTQGQADPVEADPVEADPVEVGRLVRVEGGRVALVVSADPVELVDLGQPYRCEIPVDPVR